MGRVLFALTDRVAQYAGACRSVNGEWLMSRGASRSARTGMRSGKGRIVMRPYENGRKNVARWGR